MAARPGVRGEVAHHGGAVAAHVAGVLPVLRIPAHVRRQQAQQLWVLAPRVAHLLVQLRIGNAINQLHHSLLLM
eukprot:1179971-Prorocentrum_minimum.AAC.1